MRRLIFDRGPREGVRPLPEGKILDDLAVAKHETIGKAPANPIGRACQLDLGVEENDHLVPLHQELFRVAAAFGPCPASLPDVLLHRNGAAVGAGGRKSLGLDAHDLRIKIPGDRLHVIAINCGEKFFECFRFGAHGSCCSFGRWTEKGNEERAEPRGQRADGEAAPRGGRQRQPAHAGDEWTRNVRALLAALIISEPILDALRREIRKFADIRLDNDALTEGRSGGQACQSVCRQEP
jgi:hypothetical protein